MRILSKFRDAVKNWNNPWNVKLDFAPGKPARDGNKASAQHIASRYVIRDRGESVDVFRAEVFQVNTMVTHTHLGRSGVFLPQSVECDRTPLMTGIDKAAVYDWLEREFHQIDFASESQLRDFRRWQESLPEKDRGFKLMPARQAENQLPEPSL